MNKKGFTLIELLAVIVILAIIALIATPIVLNIIDDTKEESSLRSAEFYLKGLELSIAQEILEEENIPDGVYNVLENGNICLSDEDCTNPLTVEVKGKKPESGTILIQNGQIKDVSLNIDNKIVVKKNNKIIYSNTVDDICEIKKDVEPKGMSAGDKYECKVNAGTKHTFYVLTTPNQNDSYVNLIMNQNINSDGTEAGMTGIYLDENSVYNLVPWSLENEGNLKGPITAMQFLYEATKSWTNIEPLNYVYEDIKSQNVMGNAGYTSIIYSNGIATVMSQSGEKTIVGTRQVPFRVRMPIYLDDSNKTEVADKTSLNEYLYDNLDPEGNDFLFGYWTFSSSKEGYLIAWHVDCEGTVYTDYINEELYGIRPVITIKYNNKS